MEMRLTPAQLLATPDRFRAWIESMPEGQIVSLDITDPCQCMGVNFLKAQGYAHVMFGVVAYAVDGHIAEVPDWFRDLYAFLMSLGARAASAYLLRWALERNLRPTEWDPTAVAQETAWLRQWTTKPPLPAHDAVFVIAGTGAARRLTRVA